METEQLLILVGTFIGTGGFAAFFSIRAKNDLTNVQASGEAVKSLNASLQRANEEISQVQSKLIDIIAQLDQQRCISQLWQERALSSGWKPNPGETDAKI